MSRLKLPSPLIPAGEAPRLLRRLLIVAAVALLIALANWSAKPGAGGGVDGLDTALVYSFAISLLTWAAVDPVRLVLRGPLRTQGPGWWPGGLRAVLLLAVGIPLGYAAGTAVGDLYAGQSTFELLRHNGNRFTGLLLSSFGVSLGFVGFFYQRGRNEALARQAREAQLALLQSQLEPHMLFNTLANLRALISIDPPRAQAMLDRLIAFLRTTLEATRAGEHPLEQEFARVADYLALIEIRMGPRLATRLDLPDALRGHPVPPMLLQPLVENAIKHGLEPKVAGGRVAVTARRDGARLVLEVRDTGIGLRDTAAAEGSRFGNLQISERLRALHGAKASLALEPAADAEGGTLARITLPWRAAMEAAPGADRYPS